MKKVTFEIVDSEDQKMTLRNAQGDFCKVRDAALIEFIEQRDVVWQGDLKQSDLYRNQLDYSISLQRAIEYHSRGRDVPDEIAKNCPHHAKMLNKHRNLTSLMQLPVVDMADAENLCMQLDYCNDNRKKGQIVMNWIAQHRNQSATIKPIPTKQQSEAARFKAFMNYPFPQGEFRSVWRMCYNWMVGVMTNRIVDVNETIEQPEAKPTMNELKELYTCKNCRHQGGETKCEMCYNYKYWEAKPQQPDDGEWEHKDSAY